MQPVTNKATVSDEHTQDLEATISGLPSSQHLTAELEVDGKCQETSETTRELEFSGFQHKDIDENKFNDSQNYFLSLE